MRVTRYETGDGKQVFTDFTNVRKLLPFIKPMKDHTEQKCMGNVLHKKIPRTIRPREHKTHFNFYL